MKKIFALLLAVACLLSLVACGDGDIVPLVTTQPTDPIMQNSTTQPTTESTTVTTVAPTTLPVQPEKNGLQTDKQLYEVYETVTFICTNLPGVNTLRVTDPNGTTKSYPNVGAICMLKVTMPGTYVAVLETVTNTGVVESELVQFVVVEQVIQPTTAKPVTVAPATVVPATVAPTIVKPTTIASTMVIPTTVAPTTAVPTTVAPTTAAPTTVNFTTANPTTEKPTTAAPTTVKPTTIAPTTAKPTTAKMTTAVATTKPSNDAIQLFISTSVVSVNDPVTFTAIGGATSIVIYRIDGEWQNTYSVSSTSLVFGWSGSYAAYATDGTKNSNTVYFEVVTSINATTVKPTTAKPTTAKPTTVAATTVKSTTAAPTTAKPTTAKPTTAAPTTAAPTTVKPTTAPTTQPQQLKILCESYDWVSWSNGEIIAAKKDRKYGAINTKGEVIVPFVYDGIKCSSSDGYLIACNSSYEEDEPNYVKKYTEEYFVYNEKGQILYETNYKYNMPYEIDIDMNYYGEYEHLEGEEIFSVNEGVMVTGYYVYSSAWDIVVGGSDIVKHIAMRRVDGTIIKEFDNVTYCSTMINGKMVIAVQKESSDEPDVYCIIVDKNGNVLQTIDYGAEIASGILFNMPWACNGINDGYFMAIEECGMYDGGHVYSGVFVICNATSNEYYKISSFDIDLCNYGTLFVSNIYDDEGYTTKYYLLDAVNLTEGHPTIEAAVSKTGYDSMSIPCMFGQKVKYAFVSRDGKWGYLSLDGKTEKLYDDAGEFHGGLAIVKDETGVYVINENFEKVSNTLTGYDSISSIGKGVYQVKKDGVAYLAIYNP